MRRLPLVPPAFQVFDGLASKTDLLEIAYHFALRLSGTESEQAAFVLFRSELELLAGKRLRIPTRWKSAAADAARAAMRRQDEDLAAVADELEAELRGARPRGAP